jgi:hypothetical protein
MPQHNDRMLLAMAVLFSAFLAGGVSQLRADDWGGHCGTTTGMDFGTVLAITISTIPTIIIAVIGINAKTASAFLSALAK